MTPAGRLQYCSDTNHLNRVSVPSFCEIRVHHLPTPCLLPPAHYCVHQPGSSAELPEFLSDVGMIDHFIGHVIQLSLALSVGCSLFSICQDCRFHPWSGYIQGSTNECISKWNKLIFLSLFFSLKSMNQE